MMVFIIFSFLCPMAFAMDTKGAFREFMQSQLSDSSFSRDDSVQQQQGDRSTPQPVLDPSSIDVCLIKSQLPQYTCDDPLCYRGGAWVKNVYMQERTEEVEEKPEFEVIYNKLGQSWKVINLKANRLDMYVDYYSKVLDQIRVIVIVPKNTARFRLVSYGNHKLWLSRDEFVDSITYIQSKDNSVEYVEIASVTSASQHRYVHFVRYQLHWNRDTFLNQAMLRMGSYEKKKLLIVRKLENYVYKMSKPSYRVTNKTIVIPRVGEYFGRIYFEEQLLWEISIADPKFFKKVITKRFESKEYHISAYMYGRFGDELIEFLGSNDFWMVTHTCFWDPKALPQKYILKHKTDSGSTGSKKKEKMLPVTKAMSSSTRGSYDSSRSLVAPGKELRSSNAVASIMEQLQGGSVSTSYDPLAFSIGKMNAILKCFIDVSNQIFTHTSLQLSIINKMLVLASSLSNKRYTEDVIRTLSRDDTPAKLREASETIAVMLQRFAVVSDQLAIADGRTDDEKRTDDASTSRERLQH